MKKLLKILSMAVLVMIAVLNKTDVWAAENTADNSQIQINIKNSDHEFSLQPLEENGNIFVGNKDFYRIFYNDQIIIEGVLPDSESKVTEVFGSLDIYNEEGTLFADSDKKIENTVKDGKTHFIITYSNIMSDMQMYSNTSIFGALYFDIKVEAANGKETDLIAVFNTETSFGADSGYPFLVEYLGIKNNETDEILSGETEKTNFEDGLYHYAELSGDIDNFSMVVNRQQNKMETINISAITKS